MAPRPRTCPQRRGGNLQRRKNRHGKKCPAKTPGCCTNQQAHDHDQRVEQQLSAEQLRCHELGFGDVKQEKRGDGQEGH
jgi:hypothetical protein